MKQFEIENTFATGKIYLPGIENIPYPGIIIVSGSDGGIPGNNAIPEFFIQEIVNHGFAVFALAYFGYNNLPPLLEKIPLEYFLNAINWFKSQDYINDNAVGIIGQSRGGELALILGSLVPNEFNAIVSIVPSDMVCGGFPHPQHSCLDI